MMSTKICGRLNLIFHTMVKSIFKIPEHHVNLQRNAFDLGNTELFTQSLGQLLPVFVREVNPNEHVRINTELYARTQPLNSSALVQIKQNVDYFFVPYRLLWSRAQQFFPKTDYGTTTVLNPSAPTYVPNVPLGQFYSFLSSQHTSTDTYLKDDLGYRWSDGALRLLDMLGYGDFLSSIKNSSAPSGSEHINIFRILAYQKVYQDFYRNQVLEKQDLDTFNIDRLYETYGNNGSGNLFATSSPDLTIIESGLVFVTIIFVMIILLVAVTTLRVPLGCLMLLILLFFLLLVSLVVLVLIVKLNQVVIKVVFLVKQVVIILVFQFLISVVLMLLTNFMMQ